MFAVMIAGAFLIQRVLSMQMCVVMEFRGFLNSDGMNCREGK